MNQNPAEKHASTVCLDGREVKRQREIHGLTQLYISKVVGVTTDTISRWENNRYPTIRRENALNLAAALEVPLEQILQKPADEDAVMAHGRRRYAPFVVAGAAVLLLSGAIAAWLLLSRQGPVSVNVTASRSLPVFAAPETAVPVRVRLERDGEARGFILRENFPMGWQIVEASPPPSSLDNVHGVARWIVKAGDRLDRIVYLVQVADAATDDRRVFQGEIIAGKGDNQISKPVLGDIDLKIAPIHWADADGDGRIDDLEMLETSYIVDEMTGVHLDWDYLESLWDAEGYRWDEEQKKFLPVHVEEELR